MANKLLTVVAGQQADLVAAFRTMFEPLPIRGTPTYHAVLAGPAGPSTGGGVQALQHINLAPEDGGATVVAGWVNPVRRTAELRSFEYIASVHASRFKGATLGIDPPSYDDFLKMLQLFLVQRRFTVEKVGAPRRRTEAMLTGGGGGAAAGRTVLLLTAAIGILMVLFTALLAWRWLKAG